MLKVSQKAPDFCLPDQNGLTHTLSDHLGSWVLLYFYPKDDTPGCTTEACTIRDHYQLFKDAGLVVLGVSVDSIKSHATFAKKYALPFTLLSDEKKEVVNQYGVWALKKLMGHEYMGIVRTSFMINGLGKIVKIYERVKPAQHTVEILKDIALLKGDT